MFNLTPDTHFLLSLFICVVAFLIAQIITHPDTEQPKNASKAVGNKVAPTH